MHVEAKLALLGLPLPEPMRFPEGFRPLWRQVRVMGTRAVIAGHGPRELDGTPPARGGKVGADLTPEERYQAARSTALAVLGDLKREIGNLDRVVAWVRVFGLVNSAPGFVGQARVIDGFTPRRTRRPQAGDRQPRPRRRLERCRLRLLDPRCANRRIATLAFESGFADLSGFNRAFRATYGMTPRQFRSSSTLERLRGDFGS